MARRSWVDDKEWADAWWTDVESIIRRVAGRIITVEPASPSDDQKLARDYVVASGTIACRLRRPDRWRWRGVDITIRVARPLSGNVTELEKFCRGDCRWMLFGWTTEEKVGAWVFIDIARLIAAGLHEEREPIRNFDDSSDFIAIPVDEIVGAGAIVDCELDTPTQLRRRGTIN